MKFWACGHFWVNQMQRNLFSSWLFFQTSIFQPRLFTWSRTQIAFRCSLDSQAQTCPKTIFSGTIKMMHLLHYLDSLPTSPDFWALNFGYSHESCHPCNGQSAQILITFKIVMLLGTRGKISRNLYQRHISPHLLLNNGYFQLQNFGQLWNGAHYGSYHIIPLIWENVWGGQQSWSL